jgi:hypothetical protein
MKRLLAGVLSVIAIAAASDATAQVNTVLFQENFDSLTLGPSVNERQLPTATTQQTTLPVAGTVARPNAFTHTPPAGWSVDPNFNNFGHVDLDNPNYATGDIVGNTGVWNHGSPIHGTDEWDGWSFADKNFWVSVDDQNRSQFTNASGNVAVADPDEYDDLGDGLGGGYYNTGMTTNNINVAGKASVNFSFDSSWRDEGRDDDNTVNPALGGQAVNNQTAIVWASFDGAAPIKVTQFDSDAGSPDFKDDTTNERLTFPITVPGGAQNMKLTLGMLNAGNDWWWAVDNLAVNQGANRAYWKENFDSSVTLCPSVNERLTTWTRTSSSDPGSTPLPNAFTHTPPAGWNVDNTLMGGPPVDDDFGTFEWEGWTFTTTDFSVFTGNSQYAAFTKSTGNHAVADSDQYYALGSAAPLSTVLETPNVNITGQAANTLKLQFDSLWQTSGAQEAVITVDYGSGEVQVMRWASDNTDPDFHATNLNETVNIDLNNPAGATTAKVRIKYLEGNNDWFWAVDNIKIGTSGLNPNGDFDGSGFVDGHDFLVFQLAGGSAANLQAFKNAFGTTPVGAVPEPGALGLAGVALVALAARRRRAAA